MDVVKLTLGIMQTNCYLVSKNDKCLIIDPGDEPDFIHNKIIENELTPVGMVATHGHFDHTMATLELKINHNLSFYASKLDNFLLERQKESVQHFQSINALPAAKIDINLDNKSWLKIDDFKAEIIKTPGHTPGSVSLYFEKDAAIFSGDLIFKNGIGRYDFSYAEKDKLKKSLRKIAKLPEETVIYPGHGENTTVSKEKGAIENYLSFL